MPTNTVSRGAFVILIAALTFSLLLPLLQGRSPFELGLDLSGGTRITYRPAPTKEAGQAGEDPAQLLELAKQTLTSRLYRSLDTVPDVVVRSDGRIVVSIPGSTTDGTSDAQAQRRAVEIVGRTYQLSFRLVKAKHESPAVDRALHRYGGLYLDLAPAEFTGDMLDERSLRVEQRQAEQFELAAPAANVVFRFRTPNAAEFAEFTERHVGRELAILLDDRIEWAGIIESRIDGEGTLNGGYDFDQATEIVQMLRAGTLPLPLEIESLSTIGPSLGQELLTVGWRALLLAIGMLALLISAVYAHRSALLVTGIVSLGCLLLYTAGLIALFGLTVDLVAIAGLILSIGMGMDAFFLVFEALLGTGGGKNEGGSIRRLYSFASEGGTLFHANATTSIVVLLLLSSERLKSFAQFMMVGLVASGLTILTTRTILLAQPQLGDGVPALVGRLRHRRPRLFRWRGLYLSLVGMAILTVVIWGVARPSGPTLELGGDFEPGTQLVFSSTSERSVEPIMASLTEALPGVRLQHQQLSDPGGARHLLTLDAPLGVEQRPTSPADDVTARGHERRITTNRLAHIFDREGVELHSASSIDARLSTTRLLQSLSVLLVSIPLLGIYLMLLQNPIDRFFRAPADKTHLSTRFLILCGVLGAVAVDLALCAAAMAVLRIPLSLTVVAALLTIIGYSVNDSVVLWGHTRRHHVPGSSGTESVSASVDRILVRAALTSLSTMVPALAILLMGLEPLRDFAWVILVGTAAGTLSSLFVVGTVTAYALDRERRRPRPAAHVGPQ